jgi:hypothetical protein
LARLSIFVATLVALVPLVSSVAFAQDADGFDGYIQSGTCAEPSTDLHVELDGLGDHDIEPYLARTGDGDETVTLGYYGSPRAPGFGFPVIYTDRPYSLAITGTDGGDPVACGDILRPSEERFGQAGLAVVQLLPVAGSNVQGVALIDRGPLQRELDVTPTRVRVLLSTDGDTLASPPVDGYDGHVQDGTCVSPGDILRVPLTSLRDDDIVPYLARAEATGEPVTVAYYGAARVPGFGLAAAHSGEPFSLVITGSDGGGPIGCGDILEPADDAFVKAGLALVHLQPVGDSGVNGFAVIERNALERESNLVPTRVRALLFAPPVTAG